MSSKEALAHGNTFNISERKFSYSSFESTPVVTLGTTRYQMKGVDIIFPLVPLSILRSICLEATVRNASPAQQP